MEGKSDFFRDRDGKKPNRTKGNAIGKKKGRGSGERDSGGEMEGPWITWGSECKAYWFDYAAGTAL
jgi:hypothetical protein